MGERAVDPHRLSDYSQSTNSIELRKENALVHLMLYHRCFRSPTPPAAVPPPAQPLPVPPLHSSPPVRTAASRAVVICRRSSTTCSNNTLPASRSRCCIAARRDCHSPNDLNTRVNSPASTLSRFGFRCTTYCGCIPFTTCIQCPPTSTLCTRPDFAHSTDEQNCRASTSSKNPPPFMPQLRVALTRDQHLRSDQCETRPCKRKRFPRQFLQLRRPHLLQGIVPEIVPEHWERVKEDHVRAQAVLCKYIPRPGERR